MFNCKSNLRSSFTHYNYKSNSNYNLRSSFTDSNYKSKFYL